MSDRTVLEDRAIEVEAADRLDRGPFIANLERALIVEERDAGGRLVGRRSTGLVVGLTGRWGSGKSSVLNILHRKLKSTDHVAVALFNPWLFKGRDELLSAFFNELRDSMGRNATENVRAVVEALDKYRWAINIAAHAGAVVVDAHGGAGIGTKIKALFLKAFGQVKPPKPLTPQEERRSLEKKLKKAKISVVVLIDELDRVEDEDVRAVAQLVKAVGDIKGISYLVAYDPERVANALGRGEGEGRRLSGEAYLEKIVQHPIPLRPLFTHDVEAMLKDIVDEQGLHLPSEMGETDKNILQYLIENIRTPRELKRLLGSYAVLERMVHGEIAPLDVLGYCWILTRTPSLRDYLADNFDKVVDDPSEMEMVQRVSAQMSRQSTKEPVLGPLSEGQERILGLLFPQVLGTRSSGEGDRLSRRRNLVRLLYLGNPPGAVTRKEIEALWQQADPDALLAELRGLLKSGALAPVIDRLDDLLPQLPDSGDATFWVGLARALARSEDWISDAEANRAIAEDAATYLMRLGIRDSNNIPRVKKVLADLASIGDLAIVPWVLRKHLFRWGLTVEGAARSGDFILTKDETIEFLGRVLGFYKEAIASGEWLKRAANCEVLFVIKNSGNWDDELRHSLTQQLRMPEARTTLAAQLVPPGYSTDRKTLDILFDTDSVLGWMVAAGEGEADGSWTAVCMQRLRRVLEGRDTDFGD